MRRFLMMVPLVAGCVADGPGDGGGGQSVADAATGRPDTGGGGHDGTNGEDATQMPDATPSVDVGPTPDAPAPQDATFSPDVAPDASMSSDVDRDGVADETDNCPTTPNPLQRDADQDSLGDACDAGDFDGDQLADRDDPCPLFAGPAADSDGDGLGDPCDVCPRTEDPSQTDTDTDGIGDACEIPNDDDSDGAPDERDNCPRHPNGDQSDVDMDGFGDVCDICRGDPDPEQSDSDADGLGDACDVCPEVVLVALNHVDLDGDGQPTCAGDCDDAHPGRALGFPELCDDVDNDCDGRIDDAFADLGAACEAGLGACHAVGNVACDGQGRATCNAAPGPPGVEVCNVVDDDCDGTTDEGVDDCCSPGDVAPCGTNVGACQPGQQSCDASGHWGECDGIGPTPEMCNGVDDDCNGQVDETFDLTSNADHCGACHRPCAEGQGCTRGVCGEVLRDCSAIRAASPGALSGVYPVDPDLEGPAPAFNAYCDMTTDGGGWTLCLNSRYTAAAAHLFVDEYAEVSPEGDPFGYYDFCPQDRSEYLFSLADDDMGRYRLHSATFAVSGASPYVATIGGLFHRVGVSFPEESIRWLEVAEGLLVNCAFNADPPKSYDPALGQPAFLFWEFVDPSVGGLHGFGRGLFYCSLANNNPNELVMEAGCHYGGCREPPDFETNCWEGECPIAPSNHVWVRTAGIVNANNRGGEVLSVHGDRIQAYFR